MGYRRRIASFEPSGDCFTALSANSDEDEEWLVRRLELGAATGEATMYRYVGSDFNSLHRATKTAMMRFSHAVGIGEEKGARFHPF